MPVISDPAHRTCPWRNASPQREPAIVHIDTQRQLLHRIRAQHEGRDIPLAEHVEFNPISAYTDVARGKLEHARLFRERPVLICASGRLKNPGDYLADDLSGIPILLTRDSAGIVHAFYNVCRHRGARLVDGEGHRPHAFACPYHAWVYDHQGTFLRTREEAAFSGLPCEHRNLAPLHAFEQHGLIWVAQVANAASPTALLPEALQQELNSFALSSHHHYKSFRAEHAFNWKVGIDTFLENWHFPTLHRSTIADAFAAKLSLVDRLGEHLRIVYPFNGIEKCFESIADSESFLEQVTIIYVLFPNTLLLWQRDHFETWRFFPTSPDTPQRCVSEFTLYAPAPPDTEKARAHWERNIDIVLRTVNGEDFPNAETIQSNFSSGAQAQILFGRNEPALMHYHAAIRDALGYLSNIPCRPAPSINRAVPVTPSVETIGAPRVPSSHNAAPCDNSHC